MIVVATHTSGSGDDQRFGAHITLPLGSANKVESENAAGRLMQAANAQLDFAESDLRLVMYDIKKKQYVKVTFNDD